MLLFLGYADDLCIFANSAEDLQKMLTILNEIFTDHGLKMNETKTETLILNFQGQDYPKSIVQLNGKPLKNVKHFKYLDHDIFT